MVTWISWETAYFKRCRERGSVTNVGKASFYDGMARKERTLWHNAEDGKDYVMLNGNACTFYPYSETAQQHDGLIIGHICG